MDRLIFWFGGRGCGALDFLGLERIANEFHCYSEHGHGVYYFGIGIMFLLVVAICVLAATIFFTRRTTPTDQNLRP
jgi:hypothetical protein